MSDPTTPPAAPTPDEIAAAKAVLSAAGVPVAVRDWTDDGDDPEPNPYPDDLRDVVRGQTLALVAATTREGVRGVVRALNGALHESEEDYGQEPTLEERIDAFAATEAGKTLIAMALQYMNPAPTPPVPTPNLTVTGPEGTIVVVDAANAQAAYRIIGSSGVVAITVPKWTWKVHIDRTPHNADSDAETLMDFTESAYKIDAVAFVETYRKKKPAPTTEGAPDAPAPKADAATPEATS